MRVWLRRKWRRFRARFRLSLAAVCEESKGRGLCDDFHDYTDDEFGQPWHFHEMQCQRCGKRFYI